MQKIVVGMKQNVVGMQQNVSRLHAIVVEVPQNVSQRQKIVVGMQQNVVWMQMQQNVAWMHTIVLGMQQNDFWDATERLPDAYDRCLGATDTFPGCVRSLLGGNRTKLG